MRGKEYPNNWEKVNKYPDEAFDTCTHEEFMWSLRAWDIPSSITCIIRAEEIGTGRIKEHVYKSQHAADNRILSYLDAETHDVTVCTHQAIHHIAPNSIIDDFI